MPVYKWVIRKRVDLSYQDYLLRFNETIAEIDDELSRPRLAASHKQELAAKKKKALQSKWSHFDWIEDIAGYHVICAYNHSRPEDRHLTSTRQWRRALEGGPRTNAKKKRSSPRVQPTAAAGGSQSKKRGRATFYSRQSNGEVAWPTERLVGKHRLGWHDLGGNHFCDHPQCTLKHKQGAKVQAATPTPAGNKAAKGSGSIVTPLANLPSGLTCRPTLPKGKGKAPSDAGSDESCGSARAGRTKLFCFDCYDPSGTRCMNFHVDCWNRWHGLCHEVVDDE